MCGKNFAHSRDDETLPSRLVLDTAARTRPPSTQQPGLAHRAGLAPGLPDQDAEGVLSCGYLLCPGRGGGGGLALVVGSNLPPFLGSYVPFLTSAMVIPLTSRTIVHGIGGQVTRVRAAVNFQFVSPRSGHGVVTRKTAFPTRACGLVRGRVRVWPSALMASCTLEVMHRRRR
jgi:hypothetical protein